MIAFDGDDTLWRVEHLYDQARDEAAAIVAETGIEPDYWSQIQKEIDISNFATYGLSRFRFPHSSVQAYEQAAAEAGIRVDEVVGDRIRAVSASVFEATAPLMSGVCEVLDELAKSYRLALMTQGDPIVQHRRIADSGLADRFEIVHVVTRKDERSFSAMLDEAGVASTTAWSVGNSVPSDINPALSAGMGAIWIDAHVWAHERREVLPIGDRVVVCDSLRELPTVLAEQPVLVR
ncbi:HAD family hydrolase [Gordonia sp. GONU]|uniref:HAD family hydrolase n=1 Tax=Gordonia sp. GONU TaxID=2972949 RepID=UPI0021AC37C4|nr:HAD family hydrolase [Gordonia sp. GONU]MCR8897175.1 HAD family hydrolase [Gordonia sp. GONU]